MFNIEYEFGVWVIYSALGKRYPHVHATREQAQIAVDNMITFSEVFDHVLCI